MALEKMTITACSVESNGNIQITDNKVIVQINPTSFLHEHNILYNNERSIGKTGKELKYSETCSENVSFEIVLDGTYVTNDTEESISIDGTIKNIKNIIYDYDGDEHQPKPVNLSWGSFSFNCRLSSLLIDYTLFSPEGVPLRAKVKSVFSSYMSKEEEAKKANRTSPDLTHTIEVKAGDTLPLLCYKVYRDTSYYPDVARINGLNSLQELRPGLKLKFPPLR